MTTERDQGRWRFESSIIRETIIYPTSQHHRENFDAKANELVSSRLYCMTQTGAQAFCSGTPFNISLKPKTLPSCSVCILSLFFSARPNEAPLLDHTGFGALLGESSGCIGTCSLSTVRNGNLSIFSRTKVPIDERSRAELRKRHSQRHGVAKLFVSRVSMLHAARLRVYCRSSSFFGRSWHYNTSIFVI